MEMKLGMLIFSLSNYLFRKSTGLYILPVALFDKFPEKFNGKQLGIHHLVQI